MSTSRRSSLEETIRESGEGWLIDLFAPKQEAMDHIRRTLESVQREAQNRLAGNAPRIDEASLIEEYQRNPAKVRAFFQALGGTRSPEMLLMAWRLLQGMEVKAVEINYRRQKSFDARVVLESPYGGEDPPYTSTSIHDFALFRHVGILEIDGRPAFDGFYALRVREV